MLKTREAVGIANEYLKLASEYKVPVEISNPSDKDFLFQLVVIGEIKAGKSTFINTLVGEESPQLPVGVPVTTSTAFVVSNGQPRSNRVHFNDEQSNNRPPMIISDVEVEQYGTEDLNGGNVKGVGEIAIELPNEFLNRNMTVVIDTPGLGGVFEKHRAITWKYASTADALCYVFRSQQLTGPEMEDAKQFWEMPKKVGMSKPPIFFVQTMIDRCEPKELTTFKEENQNLISRHLGIPKSEINYFLVNSSYKEMAEKNPDHSEWLKTESGYAELENFFQQFQQRVLKRKDEHLCRELLEGVRQEIEGSLRPYIEEIREIYKANEEELNEFDNQLTQANKDITEWKDRIFPKIEQDLQRRINDYLRAAKIDLNIELAHGYRGSKASPISNSIIEEYLNLGSVESIADLKKPENISKMQEKCVQVCEDQFLSIIKKTQQEVVNAIDEACEGLEKSFEDVLGFSDDEDETQGFSNANIKIAHLSPKTSGIRVISDVLRDTSPLLIAISFAASVFLGPAGIAAKLSTEMIIGLFATPFVFGALSRQDRNNEAIKQEIKTHLDDIVRQVYDRAISRFDSFAEAIRQVTRDNLGDYKKRKTQELNNLWIEVDKRKKSRESQTDVEDQEKVEEDSEKVKELLDRTNRILDT